MPNSAGRYTVKVEKDGVQYGPTYTVEASSAVMALFTAHSLAECSPPDQVNAPRQSAAESSALGAAKLSLKEAERLEAQAQNQVEGYKATPRTSFEAMRDELLLANAQASIAVAEELTADAEDKQPSDAPTNEESEGHKVGTAYIEVRPIFDDAAWTLDPERFKRAVRNAIQD